jgi:alpha-beta hydrolase superfamily lysophospholipase
MLSFSASKAFARQVSGTTSNAECKHCDSSCRISHTKAADHKSIARAENAARKTNAFKKVPTTGSVKSIRDSVGGSVRFFRDISTSIKSLRTAVASVACAFSLLLGLAKPSEAFPVSTNETVEHAALIKNVPAYRAYPRELEYNVKGGIENNERRMNLLEWKSAEPKDAYVLCVHAWGLSAREFNSFGEEMSKRGFDTAAIDVRGFGVDRKKHGMKRIDFEGTTQDIAKLLGSVRKKNPNKKIFVVGESMGGAMALKVGAEYPELVDGVICSAPAWQIFSVKRITMAGLVDQIFGEPGFAARSVANMASSQPALKKAWFSDGAYRMNYSVPEAYDYYRLMRSTPLNAKHIKDVPVLVLQGLSDRLSKPEASARLFKRITNASKQLAIVAGSEHLVLEENQLTDKVANFVEDWMLTQMKKGDSKVTPPVVIINEDKIPDSQLNEIQKLKQLAGST